MSKAVHPTPETDPACLLERRIDGETVFSGTVLEMTVDRVRLPNGEESRREVARHKGAVAVLPLTVSGDVVIEEQYRYAHDRILFEIPAGKLEITDRDPAEAALRELREETGYRAERLIPLGVYIPSPAILTERIHLYLATGLRQGERELDADEFLTVRHIPLDTLVEMVLAGEIPDGKTQIAVLRAQMMRDRNLI